MEIYIIIRASVFLCAPRLSLCENMLPIRHKIKVMF